MMKAGELRRRAELLEDFQSMMIEVKGHINYFREPLPDIFIKLGENGESEAFSFLMRTGDMLKEKNGDIAGIWSSQVMKTYEKEPLTEEDLRILRYPGEMCIRDRYISGRPRFMKNGIPIQLRRERRTLSSSLKLLADTDSGRRTWKNLPTLLIKRSNKTDLCG